MYCRSCGKQIREDQAFCKYCGAKQPIDTGFFEERPSKRDNRPVERVVEKTIEKRTSAAPWLILSLFLILILVGVALLLNYTSLGKSDEQQAREIVESFFESVKGGDVSGAMECFTPAFQEQYSGILGASGKVLSVFGLPDVTGFVNPTLGFINKDYYQNYDFKVQSVMLDNEKKTGTVDVDVYVDGKLSQTTTINVTKYHDKWYIEN